MKNNQQCDEASALLILTSAVLPGSDHQEFNRWYNEVHVPDVLTIPEFTSCRRYRVSQARLWPEVLQPPVHEYTAVYQVTASSEADLQVAVEKLDRLRVEGVSMSPAFDFSRTTATFLLPVSDEIVKDPDYQHSGLSDA